MMDYIHELRKLTGPRKLKLNCAGAVIVRDDRILFQRRTDNGKWGLIGGLLEMNETYEEAVLRETREETGLEVQLDSFLGIFHNHNMVWSNGDAAHVIAAMYTARIVRGEPRIDEESSLRFGILETFAAIEPKYKENYLIMPGITGPYSQLVFMMGLENVLIMMYDDPDGLKEAIAKRVKHAISWLDDLIALGAETVWLGEGAASSSVISPACYAEFVAPYAKAVMDAAKERGIPCFMHVCGNIVPEIREIASTGCTAIDIDYMVPMDLVRQYCGEKACLKGNLNPVDLLTKTEEEVYQLCCQIYEETEGPMILGTGCLVAPKTPVVNIDAMVRASKAMA